MPDDAGPAAQRLAAEPPEWLGALGTATLGGDLGIRRLDPVEWEEVKDPTRYPANTILVDRLRAADTAVRTGKVLVARGPEAQARLTGVDVSVEWYADPEQPGRLWCTLDGHYPGWLWVPVTPEPEALAEVLSGMFPRPALQMADLTRHERGVVGYVSDVRLPNVYTGDFVQFNGHDLDRYCTLAGFFDGSSWGSAYVDDPLPEDVLEPFSPEWVVAGSGSSRRGQQMLGRVPSMTWRALHSRSYVSFEIHTRDLLCVRLSYRPAPASHQAVVARCNAELGFSLPGDLPLDVVGALTGFSYADEAEILGDLARGLRPRDLAEGLRIAAALAEGNLEKTMMLRRYASHPSRKVRRVLAAVASWYNLVFLLYDIALASDGDRKTLKVVEHLIRGGTKPDNRNVFNDHFEYPMFVGEDGHTDAGEWPDDEDQDD